MQHWQRWNGKEMNCSMSKIRILAHRGASYHAPENTKAAFVKAYDFSVSGIETDLQLTADGEIVIHHNYYIDSTSDGKGAIALKTLDELKKYDFGSYKGEQFAGEKILTLSELLPVLKDFSLINLELKSHMDKSVDFVGKILETVAASGMKDKILYSSFDENLLREIKQHSSESRVGLLTMRESMGRMSAEFTANMAAKYGVTDFRRTLEKAGKIQTLEEKVNSLDFEIDCLHPDYHSVLDNPSLVEKMHSKGIQVNPYTCDDLREMKLLKEAGCDAIITNRPDIARALWEE